MRDTAATTDPKEQLSVVDHLLAGVPEGNQYDPIRNAIKRIAATFPDELVEITATRIEGWIVEVDSGGGRDADEIRDDMFQHIVGVDEMIQVLGVDAATANALIQGQNDGGVNFSDFLKGTGAKPQDLKILDGVTQWYYDPATGTYYAGYKLPSSGKILIFEASGADMDSLWGEGVRPAVETVGFRDLTNREDVLFAGGVGEVEGEGAFQQHVDRVIALALDEGKLPAWAEGNAKAEELLFISVAEAKGTEWLVEQLSQLPEFKTRFPGLEAYKALGLDTTEAIEAHLEAETNLKKLEIAFGGDPDRITPEVIGNLAAQGYSMQDLSKAYSVFKRMNEFAPALEAFNQVLIAAGVDPIGSTEQMFTFLAGEASADVYELYEASSLREAAVAAGIGDLFDADEAIQAAAAAPFAVNQQQAYSALAQAARDILRFRHELNIDSASFTADDLIDLSLGMAPRSGATQAEMGEEMNRIIAQAQGFLKQKVQPFFGFTQSGRPQARSFGELRKKSV